jgi:hypothetical protein
VKNRVKQALEFINSFEETLARECASRGYYGVVCGTPPTVFITAL